MKRGRKTQEMIERSRAQARLLVETDIQPGQMTPLAYLLMVINDPTTDAERRDRLAIAAAPYCHPKLMERHTVGKKDQQAEAADAAGMGTSWVADLESEIRAQ